MKTAVLIVDGDSTTFDLYAHQLRDQFETDSAPCASVAIEMLRNRTYDVIVTETLLPDMDCVAFLQRAHALKPNCVRVVLTGNSDLTMTVKAVNHGRIFRYLLKPCALETFSQALNDALEQNKRSNAESSANNESLQGLVKVLMSIMRAVDPELLSRAITLRLNTRLLTSELLTSGMLKQDDQVWQMELAALLSHVGAVAMPSYILSQQSRAARSSRDDLKSTKRISEVGHALLCNIPRLEPVAQIIRFQNTRFDGVGSPDELVKGLKIPIGSRILKVLIDLWELEKQTSSRMNALFRMCETSGAYDEGILHAAFRCLVNTEAQSKNPVTKVALNGLEVGNILAEDALSVDKQVLITANQTLTAWMIEKLKNYAVHSGVREPLSILSSVDASH